MMSSNGRDWLELLAYPFSWVADRALPNARESLGEKGCFIMLVAAVSLFMWAIPPLFLEEEARIWLLCIGPLATVVVTAMAVSQFGILQGDAGVGQAKDGAGTLGAGDDAEKPVECRSCGALSPKDSVFCGECGDRFEATVAE